MKNVLYLFLAFGFSSVSFCQTTLIPDPNFEQALIDLGYDTPPIDGSVPTNNISSIFELDISNRAITDLTGIEDFGALHILNCSLNLITMLDVSGNFELGTLDCSNNQLTNLSLPNTNGNALTELRCYSNQLTSLDVSNNFELAFLECSSNQFSIIDVSNNNLLNAFYCWPCPLLADLDLTNNTALINLAVGYAPLGSLNLNSNLELEYLLCTDTQITNLDLSNNLSLITLGCMRNSNLSNLILGNNANLEFINCYGGNLFSLNTIENTGLETLICYDNQIGVLDLSNNPSLGTLSLSNNELTSLDVRNGTNTFLGTFQTENNPSLTCIYVDNAEYSSQNWTSIDPNSTFVENEAECAALAVGDNSIDIDLILYPSPTDNYLFIQGTTSQLAATVYNMLGKQVLFAENTDKIDVSGLPDGVYIINLSDGVIETQRKFIKN